MKPTPWLSPKLFVQLKSFGASLFVLLGFTLLAVIVYVVLRPDQILYYDSRLRMVDLADLNAADRLSAINEYRKTAIQLLGGIVIALGLYLTWRRIQAMEKTVFVTEQGQITDRFSKAVEQLSADRLAVKLGGIFALERIARDSQSDHGTVMDVLTAYVRDSSPALTAIPPGTTPGIHPRSSATPVAEVQSAITVIGRRNVAWDRPEDTIDLSGTDLSGTNLAEARLPGANLDETILNEANLVKARLTKAKLNRAQLQEAKLRSANLEEAELRKANLTKANLKLTRLNGALLREAQLDEAILWKARLNGAMLYHASLHSADFNRAELQNAKLIKADLTEAILTGAQLPGANLYQAVLREADLTQANLTGAKLIETDLQNASLRGADLSGAHLLRADLTNADLTRTDLRGATGLTLEDLKAARNYREARFDTEQQLAFALILAAPEA